MPFHLTKGAVSQVVINLRAVCYNRSPRCHSLKSLGMLCSVSAHITLEKRQRRMCTGQLHVTVGLMQGLVLRDCRWEEYCAESSDRILLSPAALYRESQLMWRLNCLLHLTHSHSMLLPVLWTLLSNLSYVVSGRIFSKENGN